MKFTNYNNSNLSIYNSNLSIYNSKFSIFSNYKLFIQTIIAQELLQKRRKTNEEEGRNTHKLLLYKNVTYLANEKTVSQNSKMPYLLAKWKIYQNIAFNLNYSSLTHRRKGSRFHINRYLKQDLTKCCECSKQACKQKGRPKSRTVCNIESYIDQFRKKCDCSKQARK